MWTSRYVARSSGAGALYPVFVHRLARLFHASFRPRLAAQALASSLGLDLHQVDQRTFTSKLLSMPSTQRSRSRGGRYRVGEVGSRSARRQINCGSQGGPCDPSTQNHAGGTPASSLLRSYHPLLHPRRRTIRSTFPVSSGSLGAAAHPGIPSPALHPEEVVTRLSNEPSLCAAIFLHPDTSKAVEHC